MRYCSHCGNALTAGASFCHHCGAALKVFVPEPEETIPVAEEHKIPVVTEPESEETASESTQDAPPAPNRKEIQEEKAFLDQTCRLLRWERKAWSICGKVFLIAGIVFAALFFLLGVILLSIGEDAAIVGSIFFVYCLIFGSIFIAVGIVNLAAAGKIPQYTDTLYKDFRAANQRCNSIGIIVLCYFFNTISLVFHLINFIRMKTSKSMINRILTRQGFQ